MSLTIRVLSPSEADSGRLRRWRERYIGANPANEPGFERLEDLRDDSSYQFGFYKDEKLAGGVRLTPVGHGLTLSEQLVDIRKLFPPRLSFLDVNRLVIHERLRGEGLAIGALRDCFQWVRENTVHDGLIALCVPRFVPLYGRVGARVALEGIAAPRGAQKHYSLINMIFESQHDQQFSAGS